MIGYKAFESDMTCRGKQYAENTVYEEPEAELCEKGMHFCKNPLDVLDYYPLITDDGELITTAEVEPLGETKTDGEKSVTTKLRIGAKLSFGAFIKAGVDFLIEKTKGSTASNDCDLAQVASAGDWAQVASSGDGAQIGSSGNGAQVATSGDEAKVASSGDWAKVASSGNVAQVASSGDWAKVASSGNGAQVASSGDGAQIGSSGNGALISSDGQNSVIVCAGHGCAVKAKAGSWITLSEWGRVDGTYKPVCVKTEYVDGQRVKADTFYVLKNGEFKVVDR